jgi:beta-glucanase (GH16 family)
MQIATARVRVRKSLRKLARGAIRTGAIVAVLAVLGFIAALAAKSSSATPTANAAAVTTTTFYAVADARVEEANPGTNYGDLRRLGTDGDSGARIESDLRFAVSGLSGIVQNVKLQLYVTDPTTDGPAVYGAASGWTEGTVTWNTRPITTTAAAGDMGALAGGMWSEVGVTPLVTGNGTRDLLLRQSGTDGVSFYSSEKTPYRPRLVVTTSDSPPPSTTTAPPSTTTASTTTTTAPPTTTTTTASPQPVGGSGSWSVVFDDEFAGPLNTSVWTTCHFWAPGGLCENSSVGELEVYNSEDVYTENGYLVLRAQKRQILDQKGVLHGYSSGMVQSGGNAYGKTPGFNFTYGFTEARLRLPAGAGLWPGYWMPAQSFQWPPEIDVMENNGRSPTSVLMTYHWADAIGTPQQLNKSFSGPDFSAGWHVFGLEWEPGLLIWYVDGLERFRLQSADVTAKSMYLDFNLAVGGAVGPPDSTTQFPAYYLIDYVRVWKHS